MNLSRILFSLLPAVFLGLMSCNQSDTSELEGDWYVFSPEEDYSPSVIDMSDWLDAPAGNHGFLTYQNEKLVFEDGTEAKFWGTNINNRRPYAEKEQVDEWIPFLKKYGINAVRFHKFSKDAILGDSSTVLDEESMQNFDYFNHSLRENGIYYGWSHIYGHPVKPADRDRLLAYDEVANLSYPWSHLNGATSSLVNFAPDLQDLNIELTVNMLNRVNTATGMRYADDPALIFIEFQNEDNIFWGAIEMTLEQAPTYSKLLNTQFSDWLIEKYGSDEGLVEAWGDIPFLEGKSLREKTVNPQPSHEEFSKAYKTANQTGTEIPRYVLDRMAFLHQTQVKFYKKFEKAVRDTGYKGTIVGSCWQAGMGPSHYYNLHADYTVGLIDRHNYYGGGKGHHMKSGPFKTEPMLSQPGSGLLSVGMQQVSDRPFSFSEWMALIPTEWVAESTPIIGLYGMGLQGWDASFHFATDIPEFTSTIHTPGVYNVCSPTQLTFYPAIARSVYRNDIKEAPMISERAVHIPSLNEGNLGFYEKVEQGYDNKFITGDAPAELLALGKMGVTFTEEFQEFELSEYPDHWNKEEQLLKSITDELTWDYSGEGLITVDTEGTQGLVGFSEGETVITRDFEIKVDNPFAVILLTAIEKDNTITNAESILLTTIARAKNAGMEYNEARDSLISVGTAPILIEPVSLNLTFRSDKLPSHVNVLDHVGRRTGEKLKLSGNKLVIDGTQTQTMYYEIEY